MSINNNPHNDLVKIFGATEIIPIDSGTATAGGANSVTDAGKKWEVDAFKGFFIKITAGTSAGDLLVIASNTATVITTTTGFTATPTTSSEYCIVFVPKSTATGKLDVNAAVSGSVTTTPVFATTLYEVQLTLPAVIAVHNYIDLMVQSDPSNANSMFVGNVELSPGDSISFGYTGIPPLVTGTAADLANVEGTY